MRLPVPMICVAVVVILIPLCKLARARPKPGGTPPTQQAVSSNSVVTPALLAIDDKSPMATSVSSQFDGFSSYGAIPTNATLNLMLLQNTPQLDGQRKGQLSVKALHDSVADLTNRVRNFFNAAPKAYPLLSAIRANPTADQQTIYADSGNMLGVDPIVKAYVLGIAPPPLSHVTPAPQIAPPTAPGPEQPTPYTREDHYVVSRIALQIDNAVLIRWQKQISELYQEDITSALLYASTGVTTNTITQIDERVEYSDGLSGYDLIAETNDMAPKSLSLGFRLDISPTRLRVVKRIADFQNFIQLKRPDGIVPGKTLAEKMAYVIVNILPDLRAKIRNAQQAAVAKVQGVHILGYSGYTTVNGIGSVFATGVSASTLKQYDRIPGAFTALANLQAFSIENSHGSTLVPGAVIYWQDVVSHLKRDKCGRLLLDETQNSEPILLRWHTQLGIELSSLAAFHHIHDTYDIYCRFRGHDFFDFKVTAGVDPTNSLRFGIEFGKTFGQIRGHSTSTSEPEFSIATSPAVQ